MAHVTAQCSNPSDLKLTVTVEMTIAEWEVICHLVTNREGYEPLTDMLFAIRQAIHHISAREVVGIPQQQPSGEVLSERNRQNEH